MIIALEGPSYAGKTTALRHLRETPMEGALFFPCYVRSLPRHAIPRPATGSAAEQLAAFETFMAVEATRVRTVAGHHGPVFLDRSVDTLLAHAHALDEMYGYGVYGRVRQRLADLPHLRPDHTLYLDASGETLALRRKEAGHTAVEPDYFLHDQAFLSHARDYFCRPSRQTVTAEVSVLQGDGDREATASMVQALAEQWVMR